MFYKTFKDLIKVETQESLKGKVLFLPTDTIYGFSCLQNDEVGKNKILNLKQIYIDKPFIVLVSCVEDIEKLGQKVSERQKYLFSKIWPGPVTIIFNEKDAYRIPDHPELLKFIQKFGPIISTSANVTGEMQSNNTLGIQKTFGDKVDIVLDVGELNNEASTIIKIIR